MEEENITPTEYHTESNSDDIKILENFINHMINNSKDIDYDMTKMLNENFWDLF